MARAPKSLIHAIAVCKTCDQSWEDYLTATKLGREHHLKTGHEVHIDQGYVTIYEARSPNRTNETEGKPHENR